MERFVSLSQNDPECLWPQVSHFTSPGLTFFLNNVQFAPAHGSPSGVCLRISMFCASHRCPDHTARCGRGEAGRGPGHCEGFCVSLMFCWSLKLSKWCISEIPTISVHESHLQGLWNLQELGLTVRASDLRSGENSGICNKFPGVAWCCFPGNHTLRTAALNQGLSPVCTSSLGAWETQPVLGPAGLPFLSC